jgi:hypothetical protein
MTQLLHFKVPVKFAQSKHPGKRSLQRVHLKVEGLNVYRELHAMHFNGSFLLHT